MIVHFHRFVYDIKKLNHKGEQEPVFLKKLIRLLFLYKQTVKVSCMGHFNGHKLHKAICRGISKALPEKEAILNAVKATLEYSVSGDNDTLNRYNIELNIKQLQDEADMLMERAMSTEGDTERYFTETEKLYDKIKVLRQQLEMIQMDINVQNSTDIEVKRIAEILENEDFSFAEFDDTVIRRIVDCIRVMGDGSIVYYY